LQLQAENARLHAQLDATRTGQQRVVEMEKEMTESFSFFF
jgi:hypothetical protein